jgi:dTDP-4-amino-4,6-dideoxy-D-galactose acyltransferase
MKIEKLKWDSDFFGINIGKLELDCEFSEIKAGSEIKDYDLIYCFSDKLLLNTSSYSYCGTKVNFEKSNNLANVDIDSNNQIRLVNVEYYLEFEKELKELAIVSGAFSRFKIDTRLGIKKFKNLYEIWIENASKGLNDNLFLVYLDEDSKKPLGILTAKISEQSNYSKVGLFAVHPTYQGNGIGRKLLTYFEMLPCHYNGSNIQIPTQLENQNACKFYQNCGYQARSIQYIYHYWTK